MTALLTSICIIVAAVGPGQGTAWWDAQVEASLDRAPARKAQWARILDSCPTAQRAGLAYLVKDLPKRDLESMAPEALAANVALAYQARGEVPWGASLPDDVFLDAVLPHISVTEPRDPMRAEFHDRYVPKVRNCKRPGEAALELNKALFRDYKVVYNTRRLRTDQCSKESIKQGMATCTGLSIMLVEACRAVGVPARLAGIAAWPGRGGNHTWVEVWDDGWHFVGAAEPDEKGLDHAWFVADAAKAIKGSGRNAVHAVTYRPTGSFFPMVWAESERVPGEDVTDRYNRGAVAATPAAPARLMVEVRRQGQRVEAEVMALDRATGFCRPLGTSLGPSADINRHLTCEAPTSGSLLVVARHAGGAAVRPVTVSGDTVIRVDLDDPMSTETRAELTRIFADRFSTEESRRATARKLLAELPWDESMRALAWTAYKASPIHESLRREFEAKTVSTKDRTSPYLWRHVGTKPAAGWALVIAMHGGGGAPKRVNDQQWHSMFERYYKEHPEACGYVYLALRAPNDEWNGFYDDAICPMVERLIRQFVLFADVDPDQVYALGASHGGYGAFVIGPKMPDRFAAVHASAAAPTDGETMSENLRDLRFTVMVGDKDTAYGRADRCRAFVKAIEGLKSRSGGYPGEVAILPGVGHSVPDRDMVGRMLKEGGRNPWPERVVWAMSDDVLSHFYWLEAPHPDPSGRIEASVHDNAIALKTERQDEVAVWLDSALVDLARPVVVDRDGKRETCTPHSSPETLCEGLERRGDPRLAAPARIVSGSRP
jgi:transglutaminase-like putative cysteine protease/poly(3-hydroxybutyrate) depolymerase